VLPVIKRCGKRDGRLVNILLSWTMRYPTRTAPQPLFARARPRRPSPILWQQLVRAKPALCFGCLHKAYGGSKLDNESLFRHGAYHDIPLKVADIYLGFVVSWVVHIYLCNARCTRCPPSARPCDTDLLSCGPLNETGISCLAGHGFRDCGNVQRFSVRYVHHLTYSPSLFLQYS
jgi:hypothetical protein